MEEQSSSSPSARAERPRSDMPRENDVQHEQRKQRQPRSRGMKNNDQVDNPRNQKQQRTGRNGPGRGRGRVNYDGRGGGDDRNGSNNGRTSDGRGRGRGRSGGRGRGRGGRGRGRHDNGGGRQNTKSSMNSTPTTRTLTAPIVGPPSLPTTISITYTCEWDVVHDWLEKNNVISDIPETNGKDSNNPSVQQHVPIVLGFDTETKPRYTSEAYASYRGPDVLQLGLASGSCLVFHLKWASKNDDIGRRSLQQVLSDSKILKSGVSLLDDAQCLWATFGLKTKGRFDLWLDWLKEGFDQRRQKHELAERARLEEVSRMESSNATVTADTDIHVTDTVAANADNSNSQDQSDKPSTSKTKKSFTSLLGTTTIDALWQWCAKTSKPSPTYTTLSGQEKGDFVMKVTIEGHGTVATVHWKFIPQPGRSRQAQEKATKAIAAKEALSVVLPGITFYDEMNTVASIPGVSGTAKKPFIDEVFHSGRGLKAIAETLVPGLQHPKQKKIQMSNWSLRELSDKQIIYAAMDAYVAAAAVDYVVKSQKDKVNDDGRVSSLISPIDLAAIVQQKIASEEDIEEIEMEFQLKKQERNEKKSSA